MTDSRRTWTCPNCGENWSIPAEAADPTACPRCRDIAAAPRPLDVDAVLSNFHFNPSRSPRSKTTSPLGGIGGLLDWRFERYLTPTIVRLAWTGCLTIFLLSIAYYVIDMGFTVATGEDLTQAAERWLDGIEEVDLDRRPGARLKFRDSPGLAAVMRTVPRVVGCLLFLLFLRVACEFFIVAFDVSTSLRRLEENVKAGGVSGKQE